MSQSDNFTEISANDSVGKVLGNDHTRRMRCLGLGECQDIKKCHACIHPNEGRAYSF